MPSAGFHVKRPALAAVEDGGEGGPEQKLGGQRGGEWQLGRDPEAEPTGVLGLA